MNQRSNSAIERARRDSKYRNSNTWKFCKSNPWNKAADFIVKCTKCSMTFHVQNGPSCPACCSAGPHEIVGPGPRLALPDAPAKKRSRR